MLEGTPDPAAGAADTTLFPQGVGEAQGWLRVTFTEARSQAPEFYGALMRTRYSDDAARVDDLVRRLSRAELEGRAVGRYGGVKVFPALGKLVGKKLVAANQDAARASIAKAIGLGYVFMAAVEEKDVELPNREHEQIWNVWAPGLNSGLIERTALPSDLVSDLRQMGANMFQTDALACGLGAFGKKARLGHLGAYYAQAGACLRALQSNPEDLRPDPTNLWKYNEFPP